jgi:hypothetical protein
MKTEGKAQLGEELGRIAVYRTLLAASNFQNVHIQGKIHYKLFVIFMIFLIHLNLIFKIYLTIFTTYLNTGVKLACHPGRKAYVEGS